MSRCFDASSRSEGSTAHGRHRALSSWCTRARRICSAPATRRGRRCRSLAIETIVRTFDIMATHASARDLLRVEKVNARIRWTRDVAATLAQFLGEHQALHDQLLELLARIEMREPPSTSEAGPTGQPRPSADRSFGDGAARRGGNRGKQEVDVAVVVPEPAFAVSSKGAVLDFLERRGCQERFAAGYHTMLNWIERAPAIAQRVPAERSQAARDAVACKVRRPRPASPGAHKPPGLSVPTRAALGRLGVRVARIGIEDLHAVRRKGR